MKLQPGDGMAVYVFNLGPVWATRQTARLVAAALRQAGWRAVLPVLPHVARNVAGIWWCHVRYLAISAWRSLS